MNKEEQLFIEMEVFEKTKKELRDYLDNYLAYNIDENHRVHEVIKTSSEKKATENITDTFQSIRTDDTGYRNGKIYHLKSMLSEEPYFGKMSFESVGNFYIGKYATLCNDELSINIINWKSPIARIYYQAQSVPFYATWTDEKNDNNNIDSLVGKLQFEVRECKLVGIPYAIYSTDENNGQSQWIQMIRDILSSNQKLGDIDDIVKTISQEEYSIIELPANKNLFIQGSAGSGKTQIALHRISYVIYNNKYTSEDIAFYAPSKHLLKSISNVLPSLGEENIKNLTFESILQKNILPKLITINKKVEDYGEMLQHFCIPGLIDQRLFAIKKFKMSHTFLMYLNQKLDYYKANPFFIDDLKIPQYYPMKKLNDDFSYAFKHGLSVRETITKVIQNIASTSRTSFSEEETISLEKSMFFTFSNNARLVDVFRGLKNHSDFPLLLSKGFSFSDPFLAGEFNGDQNMKYSCFDLNRMWADIPKRIILKSDKIAFLIEKIAQDSFIDLSDNDGVNFIKNKIEDLLRKSRIINNNLQLLESNIDNLYFFSNFEYKDKTIRKERLNTIYKDIRRQKTTYDASLILREIAEEIVGKKNIQEVDDVTQRLESLYRRKNNVMSIYESFLNDLDNSSKNSFDPLEQEIFYEDLIGLQYIMFEINGYPTSEIKLVIFDEIQDLNPIQMKILSKVHNKAIFNVFGDINQRINPYIDKNDFLLSLSAFDDIETRTLAYSYRSSHEIIRYASSFVENAQTLSIRGAIGIGVNEVMVDKNVIFNRVLEDLNHFLDANYHSIAIITKNMDEAIEVFNQLSINRKELDFFLLSNQDDIEYKRIAILPASISKGLEFDAVIAFSTKRNPYQLKDRYIFYTVCTRARHELIVYNNKNFQYEGRVLTMKME